MITRLRLIVRLLTFAVALWILAVVIWGMVTGTKHTETPLVAVWIFIGGMVVQLLLWLISKAVRHP
jgi:hypothetical protein